VPSTPPETPSDPRPTPGRSRLAEKLLPGGTEPDPRFTLANERTFLAWIRTSLALLAGGIAVEAFTA
jgi:putative membrane protein